MLRVNLSVNTYVIDLEGDRKSASGHLERMSTKKTHYVGYTSDEYILLRPYNGHKSSYTTFKAAASMHIGSKGTNGKKSRNNDKKCNAVERPGGSS